MAEEHNDDVLTFDEILSDKEYQSEFDKRVSKAIETAKIKWQAAADAAQTVAVETAMSAAEADYTTKLTELQGRLTKALIQTELVKAKARDADVIMPLIDTAKIKSTDAGLEGLTEQIAALKEGKAYLFEDYRQEEKPKGKTGLDHNKDGGDADDAKIRRIMHLPT